MQCSIALVHTVIIIMSISMIHYFIGCNGFAIIQIFVIRDIFRCTKNLKMYLMTYKTFRNKHNFESILVM